MQRWPFYTAAIVAAFLLQVSLYHAAIALGLHGARPEFFAEIAALPLLHAVITVNIGADAAGISGGRGWRLHRIIDRAWALIVISAIGNVIALVGFVALASNDVIYAGTGAIVLFMLAMLSYAEPFAALQENANLVTVVPFSFLRSMMLAWTNMGRIATFFALILAITYAFSAIELVLVHRHGLLVAYIPFAYSALTDAALVSYFTTGYLDALRREQEHLRG